MLEGRLGDKQGEKKGIEARVELHEKGEDRESEGWGKEGEET